MLKEGMKIYNANYKLVEITDIDQSKIYAVVTTENKVYFNNGRDHQIQTLKNNRVYDLSDIGIKLFYKKDDIIKDKEALCKDYCYNFNESNIKISQQIKSKEKSEDYKKEAPPVPMSLVQKDEIIEIYNSNQKSNEEENEFYAKRPCDYFGRMDFDTEFYKAGDEEEFSEHFYDKFYISSTIPLEGINNNHIIDWRSPIASLFYDNEKTNFSISKRFVYSYELMLKRRFSFHPFKYHDAFIIGNDFYNNEAVDPFLMEVISDDRANHKISDIIKSIQANQNRIIRFNKDNNLVIQGCAGSGKTMILLHRLSYLKFNKMLNDFTKVKIITPNSLFNLFISDLSVSLELGKIEQLTIDEYYLSIAEKYQLSYGFEHRKNNNEVVINREEVASNRKAQKYISNLIVSDIYKSEFSQYYNAEMVNRIKETYDIAINDLKHSIINLFKLAKRFNVVDYNGKSDKELLDYLYRLCSRKIPEMHDENIQNLKTLKRQFQTNPEAIEQLKVEILRTHAMTLSEAELVQLEECKKLLNKKGEFVLQIFQSLCSSISPKKNKKCIYKYELFFLVHLYYFHCGKLPFGDNFVFFDEGQDYFVEEYKILKLINGDKVCINVFGDVNQMIMDRGQDEWHSLVEELQSEYFELNENYRNTVEITDFCNRQFNYNHIPIGVKGPEVETIDKKQILNHIRKKKENNNDLRIAIIGDETDLLKWWDSSLYDDNTVFFGDVKKFKGLEFDIVYVSQKGMHTNERYIAFTRALSELYLIN